MLFKVTPHGFTGPFGTLKIGPDDEVTRRIAMLIEAHCFKSSPEKLARKYGFSRQRYFQLKCIYDERGAQGLVVKKRGPRTNYRRSGEVLCQVIRHRFLDPDASSEVIAQKLRQGGFAISKRTVDRIFAEFGLQKKTLHISSGKGTGRD